MIAILSTAIYAAVSLGASYKNKRRKNLMSSSYGINEDWLIKFAKSSSAKFLLGGSLAVIAFWSTQDWGAYTTIIVMFLDILRSKIEE